MERDSQPDEKIPAYIRGPATQLVAEMRQQAQDQGMDTMQMKVNPVLYGQLCKELAPVTPELFYYPIVLYVVDLPDEPEEVLH